MTRISFPASSRQSGIIVQLLPTVLANSFPDGFSNKELQGELEKRLADTCEEYNNLYALTKSTIEDYNTYKSAKSIECISGVVSHKSTSTVFYYAVSIILALMLGVVLSVLLMYLRKKDIDDE